MTNLLHETPYEMGCRLFAEGIREFCLGRYFEAHDLWEEFWQELRGPDRLFLQGLIHLAVGTYHYDNGNLSGARSQLGKAMAKLNRYPTLHWGVDTSTWLKWADRLVSGETDVPHSDDLPFDETRFPGQLTMAPR